MGGTYLFLLLLEFNFGIGFIALCFNNLDSDIASSKKGGLDKKSRSFFWSNLKMCLVQIRKCRYLDTQLKEI